MATASAARVPEMHLQRRQVASCVVWALTYCPISLFISIILHISYLDNGFRSSDVQISALWDSEVQQESQQLYFRLQSSEQEGHLHLESVMGSDVPEEQGQQSMHLPEQIARITCIVNLEVAKRGIDALLISLSADIAEMTGLSLALAEESQQFASHFHQYIYYGFLLIQKHVTATSYITTYMVSSMHSSGCTTSYLQHGYA